MKQPVITEWSPYRDNLSGRTVTEAAILSPHGPALVKLLDQVRHRCHHPETIQLMWWTDQKIYLQVVDARYGRFPGSLRLLVTFDLSTGEIIPFNNCSRAGWHHFNIELHGEQATKYRSAARLPKTDEERREADAA